MVHRAFRLQHAAGGILGADVARWQNKVMRWYGKPWLDARSPMDSYKNHPFPHLRNSVPSGVQQRVGNIVAFFGKALRDELGNVGAAMVEDVWYVLHQECNRLCSPDERYIPFPQTHTTVN